MTAEPKWTNGEMVAVAVGAAAVGAGAMHVVDRFVIFNDTRRDKAIENQARSLADGFDRLNESVDKARAKGGAIDRVKDHASELGDEAAKLREKRSEVATETRRLEEARKERREARRANNARVNSVD